MSLSFSALSVAFLQGLISSLSACVYPLIPITTALFTSGSSRNWLHGFFLSSIYVLGMAVTYVTLGVLAALGGQVFGAWLAEPAAIISFAIIFFYLGLAFVGILPLPLPNTANIFHTEKKSGFFYPLILGVFSGFIAAPCTAPLFGSLLLDIAQRSAGSESIVPGLVLAFAFAIGMGLPFLLIGAFALRLPKPGQWLVVVKYFGGMVLIAAGFHYIEDILGPFPPSNLTVGFTLVGIFLAGIFFLLADPMAKETDKDRPGKISTMFFILVAAFGLFLASSPFANKSASPESLQASKSEGWHTDMDTALMHAEAQKGPILIDFWAEWCTACHEMEKDLFPSSEFKELIKKYNVTLVRIDSTESTDKIEAFAQKYFIRGLPTLVITNPKGEMFSQVIGFRSKSLTLKELEMALKDYSRSTGVH